MSRRVFILGSTGSIGKSSVEVLRHLRSRDGVDSWPVVGLAAKTDYKLLKEQAVRFQVDSVSVEVSQRIGVTNQYNSAVELIQNQAKKGDIVIAAIVGFAGIAPVLAAIERGCDIALANKESLVAGGKIVMEAVAAMGVTLLPVDSEHSAIHQALQNSSDKEIKKIIPLTIANRKAAGPKTRNVTMDPPINRGSARNTQVGILEIVLSTLARAP